MLRPTNCSFSQVVLACLFFVLFVPRCSQVASAVIIIILVVPVAQITSNWTGKNTRWRRQGHDQGSGALAPSELKSVTHGHENKKEKTEDGPELSGRSMSHNNIGPAVDGNRFNTPKTKLHTSMFFEEAVTRLAAAVGVGMEPLIYVRRSDVVELVDALVRQARLPGGAVVTSPALERLEIMRRLSGNFTKNGKSLGSSKRKCLVSTESNLHDAFRDVDDTRKDLAVSSLAYSMTDINKRPLEEKAMPRDAIDSFRVSPLRSSPKSRLPSGTPARLSNSGWDRDHSRLRHICSPPPVASATPSPSLTDRASYITNSTGYMPKPGTKLQRTLPTSPSKKISFIPNSPRAASGGEAFAEFWSAGLT